MYCHCTYNYRLLYELPLLDAGTNSELSNASESEEVNDRDQRPRGIGGDERGSRRGGRGRGANSGRGRGGPGSKPSNSISSGNQSPTSGYNLTLKIKGYMLFVKMSLFLVRFENLSQVVFAAVEW